MELRHYKKNEGCIREGWEGDVYNHLEEVSCLLFLFVAKVKRISRNVRDLGSPIKRDNMPRHLVR